MGRIALNVVVLSLVLLTFGALAAPPLQTSLTVQEAIQRLDGTLEPYRRKSVEEGLEGRIYPFDLPSSPDEWRSTDSRPLTEFQQDVRTLIRGAACDHDLIALDKLYKLDWLVYGIGFFQIETHYLQSIAQLNALKLAFHDDYRRKWNYSANMSEEPQRELRINIAFDERRVEDALSLVPEFSKLCK